MKAGEVEQQYPRLQRVKRMLDVLNEAITEAEQQGDPQVLILMARGAGEAQVELRYDGQGGETHHINLPEKLGLTSGQTVNLTSGGRRQRATSAPTMTVGVQEPTS